MADRTFPSWVASTSTNSARSTRDRVSADNGTSRKGVVLTASQNRLSLSIAVIFASSPP